MRELICVPFVIAGYLCLMGLSTRKSWKQNLTLLCCTACSLGMFALYSDLTSAQNPQSVGTFEVQVTSEGMVIPSGSGYNLSDFDSIDVVPEFTPYPAVPVSPYRIESKKYNGIYGVCFYSGGHRTLIVNQPITKRPSG